jgi:anthranilate synthase/aminodeoxychorismate synthase-like glutamine amidotransferase
MWVLIDNYDSFTHILHHYLLQLHDDVVVYRNDAITIEEMKALNPDRIIISPGPKTPLDAGITNDVIRHFYNHKPILGICLGHQALGMFLGGTLSKAARPVHGSTTPVFHNEKGLFANIPSAFNVMRYHSLIIKDWEHTAIQPLAFTKEQELMAFSHQEYPVVGIQFHPESILTEYGLQILLNWKDMFQDNEY